MRAALCSRGATLAVVVAAGLVMTGEAALAGQPGGTSPRELAIHARKGGAEAEPALARLRRAGCRGEGEPAECWVERHATLIEFARLMWLGCQIGAYPCDLVVRDWGP
jgi:hypothetical protein